jgi:hypothetical protein
MELWSVGRSAVALSLSKGLCEDCSVSNWEMIM